MSIKKVQVLLTEDARWAVESDGADRARSMHPSRGAAISAGVQLAIMEDAVLVIQGIDEDQEIVMGCCQRTH